MSELKRFENCNVYVRDNNLVIVENGYIENDKDYLGVAGGLFQAKSFDGNESKVKIHDYMVAENLEDCIKLTKDMNKQLGFPKITIIDGEINKKEK